MITDSANKRNTAIAVLAILLGFVGLIFVFSDPGAYEGRPLRITIAALFFFLSGAGTGYAHPSGWRMGMLVAWGAVLMAGFIILMAIARHGGGPFPLLSRHIPPPGLF